MCGIIGYVGPRECKQLLLHGLERLEYRGYDSAGIALLEEDGLDYRRAVGNLQNLKREAGEGRSSATTGLGHTRWATHGGVTEANAHPLAGDDPAQVAIVLNGIVENYRELRERLREAGHVFTSETDAETVTHLIEEHYDGDLVEADAAPPSASSRATSRSSSIHRDHPGLLVGARHQCPLVVGVGAGRDVPRLERGRIPPRDARGALPRGRRHRGDHGRRRRVSCAPRTAPRSSASSSSSTGTTRAPRRRGFETFMLKEIYEQPDAVAETIGDRVRHGRLELEGLGMDDERAQGAAPHRDPLRRDVVPRRRRRPATRSRSGRACPWSTTSRRSGSTAIPCSTRARS